jgi:hypothetical protein
MGRQDRQTKHEKAWEWVHPVLKRFFTSAVTSYHDTSRDQNYIGALALAYDNLMLPLKEWKGPGEVVRKQLIQTAPQVYQTHTPLPTGIAGIQAGQIWNGQLIDNPNASDTLAGTIV